MAKKAEDDWRAHARRLADHLAAKGALRDPAWVEVFAHTPRHEFTVPDGVDPDEPASEVALQDAYADQVVATRWDCVGHDVDGAPRHTVTSSASQPLVVANMLELLDVEDGCRVLEIGTGPGYNASLLCRRLGSDNVTSVDVQADLVDAARRRLDRLGHWPHLEVGDGAQGCLDRAPFDRIVATCGLQRVPTAWLKQLSPGARVVAPMNFGGALAVLDRVSPDEISGRFAAECVYFMPMRSAGETVTAEAAADFAQSRRDRTAVDAQTLADPEFRLWLELFLPEATLRQVRATDDTEPKIRVSDAHGAGEVGAAGMRGATVTRWGDDPWPVVEHSYDLWLSHGRPDRRRLGLTVTTQRQWVWLDTPTSGVEWQL